MRKLRSNKDFRVFLWTVFNAFIAFIITYFTLPELALYSPILIPFLNMLTKYVNTTYFGDLGVKK